MRNILDYLRASPSEDRNILRQFLNEFHSMRRHLGGRRRDVWEPPTDVYETRDDVVIKMAIPGVKPEEIAVECNGEVVTVCGVRKGPDAGSVIRYHQMEIRSGYFERRVAIHKPFDPNEATAEYEDGFLYVRVPKAQQAVRHVVSIRLNL